MALTRSGLGFLAIAVCCIATSCSNSTDGNSDASKKLVLHGAGSTFAAPLCKKWIEEYCATHPDVGVSYDVVGSGEGQKRFVDDRVDFGASDSALTDQQIALVKRGVQLIPVAAGSVVLAYNVPGVPDGLKLPRAVYPDIFLGKIKFWDNPAIAAANPGIKLPDRPVVTVVRLDLSGTTYAFTDHLAAISDAWRQGPGVGTGVQWPAEQRLAESATTASPESFAERRGPLATSSWESPGDHIFRSRSWRTRSANSFCPRMAVDSPRS